MSKVEVRAWVDGSYSTVNSTPIYGAGAVVYLGDNTVPILVSCANSNTNWARMRNVAGEMLSVISVLEQLEPFKDKIERVIIFYDYEGLEKWVTGEWKARKDCTIAYRDYVKEKQKMFPISFQKVTAHTGNINNETADKLAKKAVQDYATSLERAVE